MEHATLFLDESGKSSLADQADQPFILTGVILHDWDISTVEGFFNYIKRKFDVHPEIPFHSYHLFEEPNTKLTDRKANALAKVRADFLSIIPIQIRIITVDKHEFKTALGIRQKQDLKRSAWSAG